MWIANELREDYQFVHTFEMSAARQKYSGVNAGSLVIFLSERFQTQYEDKSQVLQIKVCHATYSSFVSMCMCSNGLISCELCLFCCTSLLLLADCINSRADDDRILSCHLSVCNVCIVAKRYVVEGRRWYCWTGNW